MLKYTEDGLPVITKENLLALNEILGFGKNKDKYEEYNELFSRLNQENPIIWKLIQAVRVMYKEESESDEHAPLSSGMMGGVIFMYESFRRQYEANELEEMINAKESRIYNNLPRISEEAWRNLGGNVVDVDSTVFSDKFMNRMRRIIQKENPEVRYLMCLEDVISSVPEENENRAEGANYGVCIVYELFRQQALVDKMKREAI